MEITPDFSEAVEFTPIPPGTYKARIVDAKLKTSQASGNTLIEWELQTFGAEKPELNNRKFWHTTPIMGKGAGFLKTLIKAATGSEPTPGAFNTDSLMGKELVATLDEGKDQKTGEPTGFPRVKAVAKLTQ